jgi:fructose-specific component phosphotransferase system IIB-like protein
MKKILFILFGATLVIIKVSAQNITNSSKLPMELKGNEKKQHLDSTLIHAGATTAQVQQFKNVKEQANTQTKKIKNDSTLTFQQKQEQTKQINKKKDSAYRSILGARVYKSYNGFKNQSLDAQKVQMNQPSTDKFTKDCLDSAGVTLNQKQQFMQIKKLYVDSMKLMMNNSSLTAAQRKQQRDVLTRRKDAQYVQLLGEAKYKRYQLAKKRRVEGEQL